ncbi:hypothetical protein [Saccharococcus caldoxylosilyticus]|uniref:Uncharacterized protein n=1 Tax=Saccharococcus caldoxylosilyticus TaxID=81408 RepID=A0A150L5S2_9BACL|nr:hypothetical protein [Parageobacillus caldoxylosilyticus]KYD07657.1 hypothetical protein B4119_3408 [Parageobacillus caldoxylosilyticus]
MNEKKRLEKIKNIKNFPMYYQDKLGGHRIRYFVDELDLNWLIQQAEKAEQLQERVEELEMKYENTGAIFNRQYMQEKIEQQQQEIERLKSLVMYAEEKGLLKKKTCSYCNSIYWAKHGNSKYCPNCDRRTVWSRKKAQQALEGTE